MVYLNEGDMTVATLLRDERLLALSLGSLLLNRWALSFFDVGLNARTHCLDHRFPVVTQELPVTLPFTASVSLERLNIRGLLP